MIFHLAVFIYCALFYGVKSRYFNFLFVLISILIFALLIGLRSVSVGNDTESYLRIFERSFSNPDHGYIQRLESGYILLNRFVYSIFDGSFTALMLITGLVSISLIFFTLAKFSKDFFLSLMVFLSVGPFFFLHSGMRQGMALSILFFSSRYILNSNLFRFFFSVAVASLFHLSALIMLPFYLIKKYTPKFQLIFMFWLFSIPFTLSPLFLYNLLELIEALVPLGYDRYFYDISQLIRHSAGLGIRAIFFHCIAFLLFVAIYKCRLTKEEHFLIVMATLGISMSNYLMYSVNISRIALYFNIYLTLAVPVALYYLFKGFDFHFTKLFFVFAFFALYLRQIANDNYNIFPYTSSILGG